MRNKKEIAVRKKSENNMMLKTCLIAGDTNALNKAISVCTDDNLKKQLEDLKALIGHESFDKVRKEILNRLNFEKK